MNGEISEEERAALSELEGLSNPELTKRYLDSRTHYRKLVRRADRVSRGSAGIPSTGNQMFWNCGDSALNPLPCCGSPLRSLAA